MSSGLTLSLESWSWEGGLSNLEFIEVGGQGEWPIFNKILFAVDLEHQFCKTKWKLSIPKNNVSLDIF